MDVQWMLLIISKLPTINAILLRLWRRHKFFLNSLHLTWSINGKLQHSFKLNFTTIGILFSRAEMFTAMELKGFFFFKWASFRLILISCFVYAECFLNWKSYVRADNNLHFFFVLLSLVFSPIIGLRWKCTSFSS